MAGDWVTSDWVTGCWVTCDRLWSLPPPVLLLGDALLAVPALLALLYEANLPLEPGPAGGVPRVLAPLAPWASLLGSLAP